MREVLDSMEREHSPIAHLNVIPHIRKKKGRILTGCGWMGTSKHGGLALKWCPW
jgi:hypothetical protein